MNRRPATIITLFVWVLVVEGAPALHLAIHELLEHHHHEGDDPGDDENTPDPAHGQHSVAHKHVAWLAPPPPPVVLPARLVAVTPARPEPRVLLPCNSPRSVRIRGPPVLM